MLSLTYFDYQIMNTQNIKIIERQQHWRKSIFYKIHPPPTQTQRTPLDGATSVVNTTLA